MISKSERLVLKYLNSVDEGRPAGIGYAIWEMSNPETRKPNPSPQGMALLSGRFLNALHKKDMVYKTRWGWKIYPLGREALL